MIASIWAVIAWIPLGIGLTALVVLVILFTYDFITWYIKHRSDRAQPMEHLTIGEIREAHEAIVHLVELGAAYAYRSDNPFDPVFVSASRISPDRCGSEIPPAELRLIFQTFQRLIIARRN